MSQIGVFSPLKSQTRPRCSRALSQGYIIAMAGALSMMLGLLARPAAATEAAPIPRIPVETRTEVAFPHRIPIKTPTQTFNHLYYFTLHDGRIYYRSNPETTGVNAPWRILGDTGLPLARCASPPSVAVCRPTRGQHSNGSKWGCLKDLVN